MIIPIQLGPMAKALLLADDLLRGRPLRPRTPAPPFLAYSLADNWRSLRRLMDLGHKLTHISHWGPLAPDAVRTFLDRQA